MTYTLFGARGSDTPAAMVGEGRRAGAAYDPSEVPLARFDAYSWDAAVRQFDAVRRGGIRAVLGGRHRKPAGPWRCRGGPEYLGEQAVRLEVSQRFADDVKGNRQLHQITTLLGQLQATYYAGVRRGDDREFSFVELREVRAVLHECEPEIAKLHVLAAAAQSVVDEAHRAFGLTPPVRQFRVVADSDAAASVVDAAPEMSADGDNPEPEPPADLHPRPRHPDRAPHSPPHHPKAATAAKD